MASNIDNLAMELAVATFAFVNPVTEHSISDVGNTEAAARENVNTSELADCSNSAVTFTDGLRLEQDVEEIDEFSNAKRKPLIDMSLMAMESYKIEVTVNVDLVSIIELESFNADFFGLKHTYDAGMRSQTECTEGSVKYPARRRQLLFIPEWHPFPFPLDCKIVR